MDISSVFANVRLMGIKMKILPANHPLILYSRVSGTVNYHAL